MYYHPGRVTRSISQLQREPAEQLRQILTFAIMAVFLGWLLFGLILLVIKGTFWVLISSVLLVYPAYCIIDYYFGKPIGRSRR